MKRPEPVLPLSLLLCAGTALGLGGIPAPTLVLALAGGGALLLRAKAPARAQAGAALLFFLCGVLGGATERLCGTPPPPERLVRLTGAAAGAFRAGIDALPFPHAGTAPLLRALLSGDRSGLSRETVTLFRTSGASHLLALSGLHLGILYGLLSRALRILGNSPSAKRFRAGIILLSAGFYTLMTGASPSLVRAFLFILIRECARLGSRPCPDTGVLALALTLQLALRPAMLRSPGFQLSYAAMLGIFLLYPALSRAYPLPASPGWAVRHAPLRLVWNSAALSLACQAFTAPLAWYYFRSFPPYFLLTNLLAIPLTSLLVSASVLALGVHTAAPGSGAEALLAALTDRLAGLLQAVLGIIASL